MHFEIEHAETSIGDPFLHVRFQNSCKKKAENVFFLIRGCMYLSYIHVKEGQLFKVSVGGLNDIEVLQNFKESASRSRALQSQIKSIKKKLYEVESNFRTKP